MRGCVVAADFFPPDFLIWCKDKDVDCCDVDMCNEGKEQEKPPVDDGKDGTRNKPLSRSRTRFDIKMYFQ